MICSAISFLSFHPQSLLKTSKFSPVKHRETISCCFNLLFFLCSTSFLILYHSYFIHPELTREKSKWYLKRKNLLFYQPCDMVKFKLVTFILSGFSIVGSFLDLHGRDVSNAISKILYTILLLLCYNFGFENYSVVLSINLGLFHMFADLLSLLALYSDKDQKMMFRVFAGFTFASWIYIFLNLLPFQYMIPTLYAKDFKFSLTLGFILWYISKIWTSPLLQVLYHQLYHHAIADCPGEGSLARCLMLKDSPELRHQNTLKKAYLEVKLHHQRHQLNKLNLSESAASAKTFQTIKCVMTLKRKLKRIRENQKIDHSN